MTVRKGPSTAARENLGALYPVLAILDEEGDPRTMVLDCPGKHHVLVSTARGEASPKKGRCKLCPKPTCGATNRDGDACTLAPKHARLTGPQHENGAKRWSYDTRAAGSVKAS